MFSSNFDLVQIIEGQGIQLTGSSSVIPDASLVMRRVTLQQNSTVAEGQTDFGVPRWGSSPGLPAAGFIEGGALAHGLETYFVKSPRPGYASFAWSQIVRLENG